MSYEKVEKNKKEKVESMLSEKKNKEKEKEKDKERKKEGRK